ncbi:MAG: EMC3/TMCO1 family protein [Candidatus Thorarchaeota archaeon]
MLDVNVLPVAQFPPTEPPLSSIFILLISFIVALISAVLARYLTDTDKLRRLTRETKRYQKLRTRMLKTADVKLKKQYEHEADRMRRVQSELSRMQLKPTLILIIPIFVFFAVFNAYYDPGFVEVNGVWEAHGTLPAVIPFNLPESLIILPTGRNIVHPEWGRVFVPFYYMWYMAGSLLFSGIFRRAFGLQPE